MFSDLCSDAWSFHRARLNWLMEFQVFMGTTNMKNVMMMMVMMAVMVVMMVIIIIMRMVMIRQGCRGCNIELC